MGRIKTTAVKAVANELIREYGDKFTDDFEHNKRVLNEIKPMKSKRIRNIIAGYIAAEMKKLKRTGI